MQCDTMDRTNVNDNKSNWEVGEWWWGDAATTRTVPTNVKNETVRSSSTAAATVVSLTTTNVNSNTNYPTRNSSTTTAGSFPFAPSLLKREQPELSSISIPRRQHATNQDAALPVRLAANTNTNTNTNINTNANEDTNMMATALLSNRPPRIEPPSEDQRRQTIATPSSSIISAIAPSSLLLPFNVASSSTSISAPTLSGNEKNIRDAVHDSFVASSSAVFSSSPAASASFSLPASTTATNDATRIFHGYGNARDGDGNKSSRCRREWKTGDWRWLKDVKEEQEEIAAEGVGVEKEQETAASRKTTMPSLKPIHTHPDSKKASRSIRNCRQAKRKAAAAIYSTVDDEDEEDYEGDITEEDREEDYELVMNDCSNSEMMQGPKTKKPRKSPRQNKRGKIWDAMYELLLEYKAQHGNTVVPRKDVKHPQLGQWVCTQRQQYSKKQLSNNRILRLESIGFVWCVIKQVQWESMFQMLLEYKDQHGNTLVPHRHDKNPQLGHWVCTQRQRYSKNQLSSNRVLRLESIGFVWCVIKQVPWESMFQLLLEYKDQHGNTLVPHKYDKNLQLGHWVCAQRQRYSKNQLSSNHVLRLESIGFVWCLVKRVPWESMFQLLLEYKAQHGNMLVPQKYDKNPQLGKWVHTQRYKYSKKQLSSNRVLRLESIGFVWRLIKRVPWKSNSSYNTKSDAVTH